MTLNESKCPDGQYYCNDSKKCKPIPKGHHVMPDGKLMKGDKHSMNEVAPPGFGHTKGDKEKGVKKGGTAAAFDKARKEGRFKGSKSDMFAIMWSQKKKGDKPQYKPGTGKKYKKYQEENNYEKLKKKIGSKEKHMEPAVKEMTYQEAIDAGWEMTGEGIWWPPQQETVTEKLSFPMFKKKAAERKPEKAQDAGAKAKRKLARKAHAKYVSGSEDNVPDDIRDHKEYTE